MPGWIGISRLSGILAVEEAQSHPLRSDSQGRSRCSSDQAYQRKCDPENCIHLRALDVSIDPASRRHPVYRRGQAWIIGVSQAQQVGLMSALERQMTNVRNIPSSVVLLAV